jgi:hypothetical protein
LFLTAAIATQSVQTEKGGLSLNNVGRTREVFFQILFSEIFAGGTIRTTSSLGYTSP